MPEYLCESIVNRDSNGQPLLHEKPCGQKGSRYRISRKRDGNYTSSLGSVEQNLCFKHAQKAGEQGYQLEEIK